MPAEDYRKTIYIEQEDRTYEKGTVTKLNTGGEPVLKGKFRTSSGEIKDASDLTDEEKQEVLDDFEKERKAVDEEYEVNGGGGGGKSLAPPPSKSGCNQDADGDGVTNVTDVCGTLPNPGQEDFDNDLHGDICDNCPGVFNPDQADCNGNLIGDVCELGGTVASRYEDALVVAVPDADPSGVSVTLQVPDNGVIADLDVELQIDHTRQSDLVVELEHNGETIKLIYRPGTSQPLAGCGPLAKGYEADNFGLPGLPLLLDDSAPAVIDCYDGEGSGVDGFAGPVHPNRLLETFAGMNKQGDWTLTVFDEAAGEIGTLNGWALGFEELVMANDANYNGIPDECELAVIVFEGLKFGGNWAWLAGAP